LYDNGCLSTIDAACLRVPCLCGRYPAQEYFDREFHLNCVFFDPFDFHDLADALKAMEEQASRIELPSQAHLDRYDWKNLAAVFYDHIAAQLERGVGNAYR
jgi:hypothetical protein